MSCRYSSSWVEFWAFYSSRSQCVSYLSALAFWCLLKVWLWRIFVFWTLSHPKRFPPIPETLYWPFSMEWARWDWFPHFNFKRAILILLLLLMFLGRDSNRPFHCGFGRILVRECSSRHFRHSYDPGLDLDQVFTSGNERHALKAKHCGSSDLIWIKIHGSRGSSAISSPMQYHMYDTTKSKYSLELENRFITFFYSPFVSIRCDQTESRRPLALFCIGLFLFLEVLSTSLAHSSTWQLDTSPAFPIAQYSGQLPTKATLFIFESWKSIRAWFHVPEYPWENPQTSK